jgi:uncharacterized membrane protein HdeD (DUF308 family)
LAGTGARVDRKLRATIWLKRALLLIIIGLVVQLFCLVHVTPNSFVLFTVFGAAPVAAGLLLFAYAAVRARRSEESDA